ncbi:hypothetical protein ACNQ16_01075 [Mycoplasma sp. 3137]|uniref:hypothetical protein n=1 Tax=Mycoplasma sp. 3137 TaxID=3401687 RepID=UPI003AABB006
MKKIDDKNVSWDSSGVGFIALDKKNPNNKTLSKEIFTILADRYDILFDDSYILNYEWDDKFIGYKNYLEDCYDKNEDNVVDFLSMRSNFDLNKYENTLQEINLLDEIDLKQTKFDNYLESLGLNKSQIKKANKLLEDQYQSYVQESFSNSYQDTLDQLDDYQKEVSDSIKRLIKINQKDLENEL